MTAALPAFTYQLLPELAETGDYRQLQGTWPLAAFDRGDDRFAVTAPMVYDLSLTNTGGAVLLRGTVSFSATTRCARCLEPASVSIEAPVEGYYLLNPGSRDPELDDDEVCEVGPHGIIDIAAALYAAVLCETPTVVLCREDCQGLCPVCGANRNLTDCGHTLPGDKPAPPAGGTSPVNPNNPFAVLQDLNL
jgi:uncharacterized protein